VLLALKHLDMQVDMLGEKLGVMEMRKFIAWYLQGLPGSGALRARVNGFATRAEVAGELQAYLNRLEAARSD
jgi:tRNA-dihydrouridine synthase